MVSNFEEAPGPLGTARGNMTRVLFGCALFLLPSEGFGREARVAMLIGIDSFEIVNPSKNGISSSGPQMPSAGTLNVGPSARDVSAEKIGSKGLDECDHLASHPSDNEKPSEITGVAIESIDSETAITACQNALRQTPQERRLMFQLGRALYSNKQFQEARTYFERSANLGKAQAMWSLGLMYWEGVGVAKDHSIALEWLEKAADSSGPDTMVCLGYMLFSQKDYGIAWKWFEKSAKLENPMGMYFMGILNSNGFGVRKNPQIAISWYEKSARLGDTDAMNNLGVIYSGEKGVTSDRKKAFYWFEKAASMGHPLESVLKIRDGRFCG